MGKIAHFHGQVNEATLPDGRKVTRERYLLIKVGENISLNEQVDDYDHFLYQNLMPISNEDLIGKYGGVVPVHLRGSCILCSCGAEGILMLDGPYANKLICKSYVSLGKHQTSFQIKDGKLIVDKKTQSEYMADPNDILSQDLKLKRKL